MLFSQEKCHDNPVLIKNVAMTVMTMFLKKSRADLVLREKMSRCRLSLDKKCRRRTPSSELNGPLIPRKVGRPITMLSLCASTTQRVLADRSTWHLSGRLVRCHNALDRTLSERSLCSQSVCGFSHYESV
jgi:hypothetical protein